MARWAVVENNVVTEKHYEVPINWRNVSNLNCLPQTELKKFGWYPVTVVPALNYNPKTHEVRKEPNYVFHPDYVEEIYDVVPKPVITPPARTVRVLS